MCRIPYSHNQSDSNDHQVSIDDNSAFGDANIHLWGLRVPWWACGMLWDDVGCWSKLWDFVGFCGMLWDFGHEFKNIIIKNKLHYEKLDFFLCISTKKKVIISFFNRVKTAGWVWWRKMWTHGFTSNQPSYSSPCGFYLQIKVYWMVCWLKW